MRLIRTSKGITIELDDSELEILSTNVNRWNCFLVLKGIEVPPLFKALESELDAYLGENNE